MPQHAISRLLSKMIAKYLLGFFLCLIYLSLLGLQDVAAPVRADDEAKAEPAFPQLTGYGKNSIKIVSESVDERLGRQTSQEYHDTYVFQSAYVTTTVVGPSQEVMSISAANDYQVKYIDMAHNLAYSYRPFQCKVARIGDLDRSLYDEEQNWNYNHKATFANREQRFFGVYGLWMYANSVPRTFQRAQIIYSAAKDIYRESLLWVARDEENKMTISLYFIQHDADESSNGKATSESAPKQAPSLEMIHIDVDDSDGQKVRRRIRTINILSIEHTLSPETYSDLFEPPVGFGCFSSLIAEGDPQIIQSRRHNADKWRDWAQHSLHAELEVTGTKYTLVQSSTSAMKEETVSETYNVEVAQSKVQALREQDFIEMIRLRNTAGDKKVVINHMMRVLYAIDMRTGTCDMSHISSTPEEHAADRTKEQNKTEAARSDELYEMVSLKFKNNGLALDVGLRLLKDPDDLHFIKQSSASAKSPGLHYYEGSATEALKPLEEPATNGGARRKVRMIQTYTRARDNLDLDSITIWVLNEQQTRILESYLINVLDARALKPGWPDEAKMFDVSEECYLENERMVQNRDYAWFELTYPAQRQMLNVLAANEQEIKREFYERVVTDFSRVPRLEVLFEEDSFILRMLKLDVPATELVYDKFKNQALMPATEQGDLNYLAPDLAHCGHYCRMHLCTVMSYCAAMNACVLSSRQLASPANASDHTESTFIYSDNPAWDTYRMPAIIERNQVLKENRLQSTIAKFQHQNYGVAALPEVPDEISLPRLETGLSMRDYMSAIQDYQATLDKALESDNRLPELAISALIDDHFSVFVPTKFELEDDPLRDFNIYDGTDDDENNPGTESGSDQSVPRFHQGLPVSRYNLAAPAAKNDQTRDEVNFRAFSGLTYDQCAMACADSKCGSFSYCNHQGGDCVLSNINNVGRARTLGVLQDDSQCFIAQRDFLRNFDKFPSVFRPQVYTKTSDAGDASECALKCVSETKFKCLSFEFCDKTLTPNAPQGTGQCYYQIERHLPGGEQLFGKAQRASAAAAAAAKNESLQCDHYSRSYLADFVRLESRKLADGVVEQLKTSSFNGLSVFSCAEKCATELLDCTGFQFCHTQGAVTSQQARECTTVESKITPKVLTVAGLAEDTQTLVDEEAGGHIEHAAKYLQFDEHCQVFTLRKDTAEAHLRDLAFAGLVQTKEGKEAEELARASAKASGSGISFLGGLFLYIVLALVSAAIGCGVIILKDNTAYVQQRVDRLRILVGV